MAGSAGSSYPKQTASYVGLTRNFVQFSFGSPRAAPGESHVFTRKKWRLCSAPLVFPLSFYFIYSSMNFGPGRARPFDDAAFGDYDYTIEGEPVTTEKLETPSPPCRPREKIGRRHCRPRRGYIVCGTLCESKVVRFPAIGCRRSARRNQYQLVTAVSEAPPWATLRSGKVIAERPQILTPASFSQRWGFGGNRPRSNVF